MFNIRLLHSKSTCIYHERLSYLNYFHNLPNSLSDNSNCFHCYHYYYYYFISNSFLYEPLKNAKVIMKWKQQQILKGWDQFYLSFVIDWISRCGIQIVGKQYKKKIKVCKKFSMSAFTAFIKHQINKVKFSNKSCIQ